MDACAHCGKPVADQKEWEQHDCPARMIREPIPWNTPTELALAGNVANSEWAVIEAALTWDAMFPARQSTIPEDDELHFAIRRLIAARDLHQRAHQTPEQKGQPA